MVSGALEDRGTRKRGTVAQSIPAPLAVDPSPYWFALYIIRNHEKRVEQQLRTKGVEAFLPLCTVTKQWRNHVTAKVEMPLFPGYVFVRIARTERVRVLEVPSVVSIVGNGREALPLPDAEIEAFRAGLHLQRVDPYPYLKEGNRVRIRCGPMAGLEGIIVRTDNRLRVVISIDLIMRSVAVHVQAEDLEAY
jgi:transcription antitermination factor NusG